MREISDRLLAEVVEAMNEERERWRFSHSPYGCAVERWPSRATMAAFDAMRPIVPRDFKLERYPLFGGVEIAVGKADEMIREAQARAAIQAVREHCE